MPKIIRNYLFENDKLIICEHRGLFDDMPHAYCDYGKQYRNPVVVTLDNGKNVIFEREELEQIVQKQKEKEAMEKKASKKEKEGDK